MAEFPYCTNSSSVRRCMEAIQNGAVPRRVSAKYLEGLNFRGSDVRSLSNILRALGFISASGLPTKRWRSYRDKAVAPGVMALALQEAYAELFDAYPDVYAKGDDALTSFFGSQTDVAPSTRRYMVRTFRTLCGLADFEANNGADPAEAVDPAAPEAAATPPAPADSPRRELAVNLTVQLQLPATDDPRVYEALFSALRRHLLD